MKKFLVSLSAGIIIACSNSQTDESTSKIDSLNIEDTITVAPIKDTSSKAKEFSFSEIIKAIPENEKDLDYNETFFDNYEAIQQSKSTMIKRACEKGMFPESIICPDTAYFSWKRSINEFKLVCFMTIDWNAKGPSVIYHLMTVENSTGELIASLPDWAASYSFSVENPNGGTSAGIKYVNGSITNNPVLRIGTTDEKDNPVTFELSPDGFFVEPYAQFEAETNLQ